MANNKRKKIMIAIPTDCMIHHKVVGALCNIILQGKHDIITYISAMSGIGEHRNIIVKAFLDTDFDYLLQIDSDNPPPVNILDLVDLDKDVISCPTPINMNWQGVSNIYWNVFKDGMPIKATGKGLVEVDGVGTGCILIHRRVLKKIKHPFTTVRDEDDMRIVGTDLAFSKRCKEHGFELYVHWDYQCRHYKEIDLLTIKERLI